MKFILWLLTGVFAVAGSAFAEDGGVITVRVIAFNDFHGHLQSPGNVGKTPAGGADFLAGYVNALKSGFPFNAVVSAGDLTGASPMVSGAFHDEGAIEVMNLLGLEFNAVGNHEFDSGRAELLRKQFGGCFPGGDIGHDTCMAKAAHPVPVLYPFQGARFTYLAANVVDKVSGETLFPAYRVKTFTTPAGQARVAFIGMTLKGTPEIVNPSGVAGLDFLDEAETVNRLASQLRAQGVESIVVLLHQGANPAAGPLDINDCALLAGGAGEQPAADIVRGFDDAVDAVISGHTHASYTCRLPNKSSGDPGRQLRPGGDLS